MYFFHVLLLKSDYCFHLQKNNSYKREKFNLLGFKTIRCLEHVYACLDKKKMQCADSTADICSLPEMTYIPIYVGTYCI